MCLMDCLTKDLMIPEIEPTQKDVAVYQMIKLAAKHFPKLDPERLLSSYVKRERIGSTGIGLGIAIPIADSRLIDNMIVVL